MKKLQTKLRKAKRQFCKAKQKYRIQFGLKLNSDNYYREIYVQKNNQLQYRNNVPSYLRIADKRLDKLIYLYKNRKLNRKKRKKNYLLQLKYYGKNISINMKKQIWKQSIGNNNIWNR